MPPTLTAPRLVLDTRFTLDLRDRVSLPDPDDLPKPPGRPTVLKRWPPVLWWRDWLRRFFWDRLSFTMQAQEQANWCWAAVSTSVAHYYDPGSTWTQCAVANDQLGRSDCCGTGASGPCNVYGFLGQALQTVGHFVSSTGGTSDFVTIDGEIAAGRPVGIRVAWNGGGAHFLAIIGTREVTPTYVAVDDPIYGKSDHTWDDLVSSYQGDGDSWTHTYFTQP